MAPSIFVDLTLPFAFLLLLSTLGPLLFGYHLAELNAPQKVITCKQTSLDPTKPPSNVFSAALDLPKCIPMSEIQFGLVSSFFTLGGLAGALVAGPVTTKQGRWKAMLYTGGFATIGPVFEALAPNIATMAIGRFLSGIGAGASTVVVPIYISEIAPPGKKGFYGTFTQVMINFGIFIAQLQGLFLSKGKLWRIILGVGGAIALAQVVGLLLAGQESPKWLADNGKPGKAKKILRRIRGHGVNIQEEVEGWRLESEQDLDDEEETLLTNADHTAVPSAASPAARKRSLEPAREVLGVFAVLRHRESASAVLAVVVIMTAQQFCGINSIVMYGVGLLSHLLAANAALLNVAVAALNVLITLLCAPLVERLGRKPCLLASMAGMGAGALLLAASIIHALPALSAVAVVLFVASFGIGLGPVPFILSSELVGAEAVGATQSWALAANWIATFVVAQFFPVVNQSLPPGHVYFIFAAFALCYAVFTAWYVPETKGKSDADEVWGRKKCRRNDF